MRCAGLFLIAAALWLSWPVRSPGQAPAAQGAAGQAAGPAEAPIDFHRARELMRRRQAGERLTAEEAAYLERAIAARKAAAAPAVRQGGLTPRDKTGLVPLTEMSATDRYKGEDGGLYGQGRNTPPPEHRQAALAALARIQPLDRDGRPAANGKIVFLSISMSNATQEFSVFKRLADADPAKSPRVTIVDGAQGGQAMAEWADPQAPAWREAERRLAAAGVTHLQVQAAWIKLANKGPQGDLVEHGKKLARDTLAVIQNAKTRFPNLQIAYLSSRIYGGYATGPLNPEPYAYESAFVVRWLIQDQMRGEEALCYDAARGPVKAPVLVWGPYLWADGLVPRKSDGLVYTRDDLAADGTHPSPQGREKVARLLLDFFKTDELAQGWFTGR